MTKHSTRDRAIFYLRILAIFNRLTTDEYRISRAQIMPAMRKDKDVQPSIIVLGLELQKRLNIVRVADEDHRNNIAREGKAKGGNCP
ncbi:hypothetical protein [Ferviditalea candida]|uniref:Uncharacterized protein n=1 Tax=Ferviditalea candida TaxID=3108399 RepID=A0ABU5ZHH5_9BACL|nr:hypothetical protein [Paenibacillaceae bacterium T2]